MMHGRHIKVLGRGSPSRLGDVKAVESMLVDLIDVLGMRLKTPGAPLEPLDPKAGFIGDFKAKTFAAAAALPAPTVPTAWLPTQRVARAWQALVSEKPFDP